jgi:hypothetical protein
LDVNLVRDVTAVPGTGPESLKLLVENRTEQTRSLVTSFASRDDRGEEFVPHTIDPLVREVPPDGARDFTGFEVPAGLPDGYYMAHVIVSSTHGLSRETEENSSRLYFEIADGELAVVEAGQWLQDSDALRGVVLAEVPPRLEQLEGGSL